MGFAACAEFKAAQEVVSQHVDVQSTGSCVEEEFMVQYSQLLVPVSCQSFLSHPAFDCDVPRSSANSPWSELADGLK